MLSNPHITPTATLNRWIVSILTFHFTLVHVAGTHHGPDGLSRRPMQPGDEIADDDEDFGDWIDRLHGFVHQINPITRRLASATHHSMFTLAPELHSDSQLTYEDIPRSENAKREDLRLLRVKKWLNDLVRPSDLSDADYPTFVRYCSEFFLDSGNLWRKDSHGAHKIVATPDRP